MIARISLTRSIGRGSRRHEHREDPDQVGACLFSDRVARTDAPDAYPLRLRVYDGGDVTADDAHSQALLGRFMRESKHEYPCKLIDCSVSNCTLMTPVEPEIGEKIIAYFDQLGGLEGNVVRTFAGGFAMQFANHVPQARSVPYTAK